MSKYLSISCSVAIALLFSFSVAATADVKKDTPKQEKAKQAASWFQVMDQNKDGKVTKDEFMKSHKEHFAKMKKDGKELTVESVETYYVTIFAERDKDGNGVIAKDEFQTAPGMDKNKDGKVTASEWKAFFKVRVKVMDKNKDGKISQEEYDAFYEADFKSLDKNGDYILTEQEWMEKVPAQKEAQKKS
jgi:Ca2+-binding EF-hand superfamily protein